MPELEARTPLDGHIEPYLQQIEEAIIVAAPSSRFCSALSHSFGYPRASSRGSTVSRFCQRSREYAAYPRPLKQLRVEWVQIDEPILATELEAEEWLAAFTEAYASLANNAPKLLLATYFGGITEYIDRIVDLPVDGLHLDLARDSGR